MHYDTIDNIYKEYIEHFPDYDGIMGVNQSNLPPQNSKAAFGIIGTKYADRFPNRQVWCPDYDRFYCDYEMYLYASKIGKFYFSEKTKLNHNHGAFAGEARDETHKEVRKYLETDRFMFNIRQNKKLLWGKTWEKLKV